MDFVSCGNLTIDDVVGGDGAIAADIPGGNALYTAAGMWVWSDSVGLCAGAGEDYPAAWLEAIGVAGIDTSGVYRLREPHALRSRAFYRPDGSRTDRVAEADLDPGVGDLLDLSSDYSAMGSAHHERAWPLYSPTFDRLPPAYRAPRGAHLAPGPHDNLVDLMLGLREGDPGPVLTLDWPWWSLDESEVDPVLVPGVTAVLAGQEELDRVTLGRTGNGTRDALLVAARVLVVKRGARGATVHRVGHDDVCVPAIHIDRVADVTGAGDAFCGGFVVGMATTGDPVEATRYGAVSASFVVEHSGAISVLSIDRAEATKRLRALQAQDRQESIPMENA